MIFWKRFFPFFSFLSSFIFYFSSKHNFDFRNLFLLLRKSNKGKKAEETERAFLKKSENVSQKKQNKRQETS